MRVGPFTVEPGLFTLEPASLTLEHRLILQSLSLNLEPGPFTLTTPFTLNNGLGPRNQVNF